MFRLQVQKASPGAAFLSAQSKPFFLPTTRPATLTLTAKPLAMPPAAAIHQLFGMKLVDMDDSLRTMLSRGPGEAVMILDPGLHADRLNIGAPHVGDAFWMVGMTRIKNFRDFAQQLLTACQEQQKKGSTDFFVRVVYDYTASDNHFRSNTQLMHLTPADMAELQKAVQP
jgi:hypothetical protein